MKKVTIHTDGGCHGNPGPGGWAAILCHGDVKKELAGGVPATTNNRMELQAAISGLAALKERCEVEFFTDSEYLRNGITKWIKAWKARGWKTAAKAPVKNSDLWLELDMLAQRHVIQWNWVRGHAGDTLNERCDQLANEAIAAVRSKFNSQQLQEELEIFLRPLAIQGELLDGAP